MTDIAERRPTNRRSTRAQFRYPEHRTGFDRRSSGRVSWYRDRPVLIAAVLGIFVLLNLLDLALTIEVLGRGGTEANPIMSALFEADPVLAAAVKLVLMGGVAGVIWALRRYRRILQLSLVAVAGFGALVTYQLALLGAA